MAAYDFIVVGAGSAGCAVAGRLAAESSCDGAVDRSRRFGSTTGGASAAGGHPAVRDVVGLGLRNRSGARLRRSPDPCYTPVGFSAAPAR